MPTLNQDLEFYKAGVGGMEAYLLSNELYWPLSGGHNQPRLTVGSLLLANRRLGARTTTPADREEMNSLEAQLADIRSRWRAAWERKAGREVHSRFGLWQAYLDEYQRSPDLHADEYSHEVQERAVLHLLGNELRSLPDEYVALRDLDKFLRNHLRPGGFIWEADLTASFPAGEYWFLYGKLQSTA
jgi:hypothetical protein